MFGTIAVVLLAAFVVGCFFRRPAAPEREVFVAQVAGELRRRHAGDAVVYSEERFAFRLGDRSGDRSADRSADRSVDRSASADGSAEESGTEVRLHNLWTEYRGASRRDRDALVARFVGITERLSGLELPADFAEARPNVLPRVRSRSYLNAAREGHPDLAAARELGSLTLAASPELPRDYVLELVYDFDDSVASISKAQLATWGVTVEELAGIALGNLRVRRTNPTVFQPVQEGLYASAWQDTYDATRLLATDVIRQLEVKGAPVVFPFSRDHLLVCGSDDEEALLGAVEVMARNAERTRVESLVPLLLGEDDRYAAFEPAKGGELGRALAALQVPLRLGELAEQRPWLERLHEASGEDVFVANLIAFEGEGGRPLTVTTWTEGVDTLLPEAERVAFVRAEDDGGPVVVPWAVAKALTGSWMEATEHYPTRWRVRTFPSDATLEQLRARATDALV